MKRVFIIHGYTGHPGKNWFPWLKSELEKLGISVTVPAMPNSDNPKLSEWLPHLQAQIPAPDKDTYLVGHSLGCITILRYLESLPKDTQTGGILLVAGFMSLIHIEALKTFFESPLDDEKIRSSGGKIIAINSSDDPHVPYAQAEEIEQRLGAELIEIPNGKHLNEKAGYKEFPLVLEKLKGLIEQA